jgi:hypothetical protein
MIYDMTIYSVRYDMVWYGTVRYGNIWYGMIIKFETKRLKITKYKKFSYINLDGVFRMFGLRLAQLFVRFVSNIPSAPVVQ